MKIQKTIQSLPLLVVAVGVGVIVYYIVEDRKSKRVPEPSVTVAEKLAADQLPISETLPEEDRLLVARAFDAPEELDAAVVAPSTVSSEKTPHPRPALLSEIEPAEKVVQIKPANTNPPYFHDDFSSLRTDAVRNPDSEQNRATVKTIMQKRQQRLAREER